jgi:hypothetical protein
MATESFPSRVAVVGSPGSGKSTLSRRLADELNLPLVALDDVYWSAGWTRPDADDWRRRVSALAAHPQWVLDGDHAPTLAERFLRAQAVVLLDTPPILCCLRILTRVARIRLGDASLLPARIRAQAEHGEFVMAGRDLRKLLRIAWGYRRQRRHRVFQLAHEHRLPVIVVRWRPLGRIDPIDLAILVRHVRPAHACLHTIGGRPNKRAAR